MIVIEYSSKTEKADAWSGYLDADDKDTFFIIARMADGSWRMFSVAGDITRTVDGTVMSDAMEAALTYEGTHGEG